MYSARVRKKREPATAVQTLAEHNTLCKADREQPATHWEVGNAGKHPSANRFIVVQNLGRRLEQRF